MLCLLLTLCLCGSASIAVGHLAESSVNAQRCELAHVHAAAMPQPTSPAQPDPMRPTSVAEDEVDTVQIHGMNEEMLGTQQAR